MAYVVLDTNVLVSAAVSPGGVPARILVEWLAGAFDLVISPNLLSEVERVLRSVKIRKRLSESQVGVFVEILVDRGISFDDPGNVEAGVTADPQDDFIVALARSAEASVIVTGDRHLLDIADLRPPAVTPRQFLTAIERHGF